jgi:acyl carrier protein
MTPVDVVREYLRRQRPELPDIDLHFDLIENRVLDSLRFVDFLYFLEERTGREIALEDVAPEDFRSIHAITTRFFR